MGGLTAGDIKEAVVDVLRKVVKAHNLDERIAEALANTIEFNLWKKILIGKADEKIHIDFRLSFKGVKPEEIGEDKEISVSLYEMVDGKAVTELFSQSLLKSLVGEKKPDDIDKSKVLEEVEELSDFSEKVMDVKLPPHSKEIMKDAIEEGKIYLGVDPAKGKDRTAKVLIKPDKKEEKK